MGLKKQVSQTGVHFTDIKMLKPHPTNPRTHSANQLREIAKSIQTFGFVNPVLVDEENRIIAGHGRVQAAQSLGMKAVPTVRIEHMTEAQKRAYIIADNKLAEKAGWDEALLWLEFSYLASLELDFDLTVTGFEVPEIDLLLYAPVKQEGPEEAETLELKIPDQPVSRLGDLWQIGPHRIFCGDATKSESFKTLLADKKANLVFIDPPYNVEINGHVSGTGQHAEFPMASGEMTQSEFTSFLAASFHNIVQYSEPGSIHYVCMDWRHLEEVLIAGKLAYSVLKNICIWNKTNGGMGSLYRSKHEFIFVYKNGDAAHVNNIQLGQYGRYRTNIWDYPGVNTFKKERGNELAMHPTVKPVALVTDAILDCSAPKDIILDCFGGSGTTLIAAEKAGRTGYLMELDPKYVDVIIGRYQDTYHTKAILSATGQTFCEVKKQNAGVKSKNNG